MALPDSSPSEQVGAEITRVVRRWQQLPLDHALSHAPRVRELAQALADQQAEAAGRPRHELPELGPAVLMDQLQVVVYDHQQHGLDPAPLLSALQELRQSLP